MRAEDNWEDAIGKRLRELETAPPPMAWNKIRQDIQPKRHRRWLWLPLVLLFLSGVPVTYFALQTTDSDGQQNLATRQAAVNPGVMESGKETAPTQSEQLAKNELKNPEHIKAESQTPTHGDQLSEPLAQTQNAAGITEQTAAPESQPRPNGVVLPAADPDKPVKPGRLALPGLVIAENSRPLSSIKPKPVTTSEAARQRPATAVSAALAANTTKQSAGKLTTVPGTETNGQATNVSTRQSNTTIENQPDSPENTLPAKTAVAAAATDANENGSSIAETDKPAANAATVAKQTAPADSTAPEKEKETAIALADSSRQKPAVDEKPQSRNAAMALYLAPLQTFQRLSANPNDEIFLLRLTDKGSKYIDRLGYELGWQGSMQVNDKFWLETTVHYIKLRQQINFTTTGETADSVVVKQNNAGQISMDLYNREQNEIYEARYHYFGAYLGLAYSVTDNLQVTGGYGLNWLYSWQNQNSTSATEVAIGSNPFLRAGLRYNLPVGPNRYLQAGPTVQYFLSSIQNETSVFSTKPITVGVTIGYQFRKR